MSDQELHTRAEELLRQRLSPFGVGLERLPELPSGYALLLPGGRMKVAKVLVRAGPHRRGRQGALGMHWMLRSDAEDYEVLVDLAREALWLMPATEFRLRAAPLKGGRWHLDWLVLRAGHSRIADETEFADYRLEKWLEAGDWMPARESKRAV